MAIDLRKEIMQTLQHQRVGVILGIFENRHMDISAEEFEEEISRFIFEKEDILDQALDSLNITVHDIDPNDFRDYQHKTIDMAVFLFKKFNN
jgi:hypothetical protein